MQNYALLQEAAYRRLRSMILARSVPVGAFPDAVLTAETITASCITVLADLKVCTTFLVRQT